MATASRVTGAHPAPALSPAERAAVAAELARLSARVANLATRLDRLHTALAAPAHTTSQRTSASPGRLATAGLVTASEARP